MVAGCVTDSGLTGLDRAGIAPKDADKLYVVDCLLPAQVRKLGQHMTFLTARRPVRTTAVDCEIRGGEYVAYDRANYATALKIWLPKAKEGDPKAQTYVGEIYEKGTGLQPDYQAAAHWYRKAAAQGYAPAMINLGFLYERGLGVKQDPVAALNWYRRASGLDRTDIAFAASVEIYNRKMDTLREESARYRQEAKSLREEVASLKQRLTKTQSQLQRYRSQVNRRRQEIHRLKQLLNTKKQSVGASPEEIRKLEASLRQQQQQLAAKEQMIASLTQKARQQRVQLEQVKSGNQQLLQQKETELAALRMELARSKETISTMKADLGTAKNKLNSLQSQIQQSQQALQTKEQALAALRQELARRRQDGVTPPAELQRLSRLLQQKEQEINAQKVAVKTLQAQLKTLAREKQRAEQQLAEKQKQLEQLQEQVVDQQTQKARPAVVAKVAGPKIEIIEPVLSPTRGNLAAKIRGEVEKRPVIGRIDAPAGLLSFLVNDLEQQVDDKGTFKVQIALLGKETPVHIVAVDKASRRTEVKFVLLKESRMARPFEFSDKKTSPGGDPLVGRLLNRELFGGYYALIIGNEKYQYLPQLDTPVKDAKGLARVLRSRYGFKTKLLINATRYDVLKALSEYRKKLTEKDNLLIYYAGHGTLEKVTQRGYWLPVDAELENTANWISTQDITDLLRIISAKHILVIADSCYSGTLTRNAVARLESGMTPEKRAEWIKLMLKAKSREALTSGGLEPVLDGGGGGHSIFAKAIIQALASNDTILEAYKLYHRVSALVADAAQEQEFHQVPEFSPIRHAGHAAGEFFFVPVGDKARFSASR